ncbi:secretory phospholipase A2 receptor-like [Scomber scombrus]|uniref:Secretory phospholipase A2 receptor-like n=1 Tax=Scomber scombrus TaxID=13677 RepID=A0AAV1NM00_SCOSC
MMKIFILVPLMLLLPPVCCEWPGLRHTKYIWYSRRSTWSEAQYYCRVHHTDLVTIKDKVENIDFFHGHGWLGLYRANSTSVWKWSRGDQIANFTIWGADDPDLNENCAHKHSPKLEWYSHFCSAKHSFMCYEERLVLVKEKKTWEDALVHCRALEAVEPTLPADSYQNHRYDLATILTADDLSFAQEKAQEATTDEVWTGLRYLADRWLWIGGEVQINNYGCVNQRLCGALLKNGTDFFRMRNCRERKSFFCYKKP